MISHANLATNLECLREVWSTHRNSIGVSWLPFFHDMGLIAGILEPLWVGHSAFLMAPATFVQNALRWLRAISRYRGTIAGGPNFAYQACVDAAKSSDTSDLDLSSWDLAWNGAEPVRASTLEQFRTTFAGVGFRAESLAPAYGLAEATLLVTGSDCRSGRAGQGSTRPHPARLAALGRRGALGRRARRCVAPAAILAAIPRGHGP